MSTQTITPEVPQVLPAEAQEAVQTAIQQPKTGNRMLDNSLLLEITRAWIPQQKTVSNKVLNSTAQGNMISVVKKLYDCPELKAIAANEVKLDEFLKRRSSPLPLRKSVHLVAIDLIPEVEQYLVEHLDRREKLLNAFVDVYEKAVEQSKELLGDQFNPKDYPSKQSVKNYFRLRWTYNKFGSIADHLVQVGEDVVKRQNEQFAVTLQEAAQASNYLLAEQAQQVLAHLVDRLTPVQDEETGEIKRKTLRDKTLDPMNEFLRVFDARNLGDHQQLKAEVDKVKALMSGVTVDQLKKSAELRNNLEVQFKEIKERVDEMVQEAPARFISFDEE